MAILGELGLINPTKWKGMWSSILFYKGRRMEKKFHWRFWGNVCKPISEGGLGVRDFKEIQKSLHIKFAYRLLKVNNL